MNVTYVVNQVTKYEQLIEILKNPNFIYFVAESSRCELVYEICKIGSFTIQELLKITDFPRGTLNCILNDGAKFSPSDTGWISINTNTIPFKKLLKIKLVTETV